MMTAMHIYGKKNNVDFFFLLQNRERFEADSWYIASRTKVYQVCSNNDRRVTLDLFTMGTNLRPRTFVGTIKILIPGGICPCPWVTYMYTIVQSSLKPVD